MSREVAGSAERSAGAVGEGGPRQAAGTVALVGGGAGVRRSGCGEAAARAGVINLVEEAVVVGGDQRLVGPEVDVCAVGADPIRPGAGAKERAPPFSWVRVTGSRGDQLGATVDVLIDVLCVVGVAVNKRVFGAEESAAIVCHEEAVLTAQHSDVGGAPLGRQETQTILPLEGSYVYISRCPSLSY